MAVILLGGGPFAISRTSVPWWCAHGWNTDCSVRCLLCGVQYGVTRVRCPLLWVVVWVGSLGWGSAGTGRAAGGGSWVRCWVLRERAGEGSSAVVGESLLVLVGL